eukprot:scaffold33273_cov62-Phaeocystis_antarctica.AAC.2
MKHALRELAGAFTRAETISKAARRLATRWLSRRTSMWRRLTHARQAAFQRQHRDAKLSHKGRVRRSCNTPATTSTLAVHRGYNQRTTYMYTDILQTRSLKA